MDVALNAAGSDLPEIPHHHIGDAGMAMLATVDPARFQAVMQSGLTHYGAGVLWAGDKVSRCWLRRNANPAYDDIAEIARAAGIPGAFLLNLSYEWTCTSSTGPDPSGSGNRLLRTLDWPLDGLGRNIVVAGCEGPAGPYENITWPGFAGVATAMAPGRFSAAINQPPMRRWTFSCWLDWGVNRLRLWRRRVLPPVHLLRRVFETCDTYTAAKRMLTESPLAMPAFFTLSGTAPEDGCVIERTEDAAAVRSAPASVANHWIGIDQPGRVRGVDSLGRFDLMEVLRDDATDDFSWVQPPIRNETTRLAVIANAGRGILTVQGWENDGPATRILRL